MRGLAVLMFTLYTCITGVSAQTYPPTHCIINAPNGVNVRLSPNPTNPRNIVNQLQNGHAVYEFHRAQGWSNISAVTDNPITRNVYINNQFLREITPDLRCD